MSKRPFPDPSILLHPQIPKPLHLLNPRTILGDGWWQEVRKEAYLRHGFCCHACGVLKYEAKHRQWLEAHEMYDIDYITGKVEFLEVVALCHFCHNFIHQGRLVSLLEKSVISFGFYDSIMNHGDSVLAKAGIPRDAHDQMVDLLRDLGKLCAWEDYHLVIDGVDYGQRFKSREEWEQYWR